MNEPKIHSHITDRLPEGHPLAYERVVCKRCGGSVHMSNNECMQTWVETGVGGYCLRCFEVYAGPCVDFKFSLPDAT